MHRKIPNCYYLKNKIEAPQTPPTNQQKNTKQGRGRRPRAIDTRGHAPLCAAAAAADAGAGTAVGGGDPDVDGASVCFGCAVGGYRCNRVDRRPKGQNHNPANAPHRTPSPNTPKKQNLKTIIENPNKRSNRAWGSSVPRWSGRCRPRGTMWRWRPTGCWRVRGEMMEERQKMWGGWLLIE